ncbi:MAG: NAD-dependent protein deacetylase [Acidothermaceae bacterium]
MLEGFETLAEFVSSGDVMVLTGAGISTDSGIPDYRGANGSLRRYTPMTFQTFTGSEVARRRYWARSHIGWQRFASACPNSAHYMVAQLQRLGLVSGVVTQNVDGLHQAAGAFDVIDLHGRLDRVICLGCRVTCDRAQLHERLQRLNEGFAADATAMNPDGDAEIADDALAGFQIADCGHCGGMLKPDVVFFGENVPRPTVDRCFELLDASQMLLVLGSSLTVMSGYRFVRHAARQGIPVAIVNQGATRGDLDATLLVDAPLGAVLPRLVDRVGLLSRT